ncbi:enoyl-CoA hydratase [Ornithinimicrobium humiphilum]|uniref:Enoyl-CoA hydratase/carnithine racemase n=1 Tax=Ornithinimicrobium humiphilum TaxID=125288 RepID=A0A543KLG1_9MICO|nr:enoyl-CoA hydratase [Ornithinimicrobium humiphilum]TQM95870.1 enoyl-CoA hydratase/carnithine racemase [Ornithinimicrobium humiphilum]
MAQLTTSVDGPVLTVTLTRPEARNAMTWEMYDGLVRACQQVNADEGLRVLLLRGSGGAFVAGTDISQFLEFEDGSDGVAYEARVEEIVSTLASVDAVTVAAVEGACVGGGLALAAACDLRVADASAVFGVPIARTLGNCLSQANVDRLVRLMGRGTAGELLLLGRLLPASRMHELGFVQEVAPEGGFDQLVADVVDRLAAHAPLTLWASRGMLRATGGVPLPQPEEEMISRVYGSEDFRGGVRAFVEKVRPRWRGW